MVKRKAYALFGAILCLFGAAMGSIVRVNSRTEYVTAAQRQSVYRLEVSAGRGMIYDETMTPLLHGEEQLIAAVAPTIEAIGVLDAATGGKYRTQLAAALEDGKPFLMPLESVVTHPCIQVFSVPERYSEEQIAAHAIGYCDSLGAGVSGIELAMEDVLGENHEGISIDYTVDALGRVMPGGDCTVYDTVTGNASGVALTLNAELQRVVEQKATALGQGAVVVTEAPGCEIRAMASVPGFSPLDLQSAAQSEDSPLINRALCAYAPGSVFKLVCAAAALENDLSAKHALCTGAVDVDGLTFHCYDGTAHGSLNLRGAFMCSCNCYFIQCVGSLGGQSVLNFAYNLGLGAELQFGRGLYSAAGTLPTATTLQNARALANFSFGQGELTVTPLQMCGLLNAVVSEGVYTTPRLILGTVSAEGTLHEQHSITEQTTQAMSAHTANTLKSYLQSTMTGGTARAGQSAAAQAGAKTGTAQTGVYRSDGEELLNFWYCGYVTEETGTTYCITVLSEGTADDRGAAGQVFGAVADFLSGAGN